GSKPCSPRLDRSKHWIETSTERSKHSGGSFMRLWSFSSIPLVVLSLAVPTAAQEGYHGHFRTATVTGQPGSTVTLGIGIANQPAALTGFSFGVKHDATKLTLQSVDIGPDLQAALG